MELGVMEGRAAAAMVRFAFEAGMAIGGGGDISDALFDAEDSLAENFGEIDESTYEGKFWADTLEETEKYIVNECKNIIMAKSCHNEETTDKERISEILACAIAEGKLTAEYMAVVLAESFIADSLESIADTYEEIGDAAYDAGIAARKLREEIDAFGEE